MKLDIMLCKLPLALKFDRILLGVPGVGNGRIARSGQLTLVDVREQGCYRESDYRVWLRVLDPGLLRGQ